MKPKRFDSIWECLLSSTEWDPQAVAFYFLNWDGTLRSSLTRAELVEQAATVAGTVSAATDPGDAVLLVHHGGETFLSAFLGTIASGRIAVPTLSPRFQRQNERIRYTRAVSGATLVLTDKESRTATSNALAGACPIVIPDGRAG